MRSLTILAQCAAALLSLSSVVAAASASSNATIKLLPSSFTPPQVFENSNLVRNVNLEKGYPRETINVVIQNVGKASQSQYYLLFNSDVISKVGGLDVRDKKMPGAGPFKVELAQYQLPNSNSYYIIHLPHPLPPSASQTLSISYTLVSSIHPLPTLIEQTAQQTVVYTFSAYLPSAYTTQKQKTKLKLPVGKVADFTKMADKNAEGTADPVHQGSSLTYGPYNTIQPESEHSVSVRYEFTKPLLHATLLERDVEISHWGGNLAVEERYWLTNRAAKLKNPFSRVQWQMTTYSNPPTTAARELRLPLVGGAANPYYTDDIGNVSTSRFRPGPKEALLEIKPRYPVFGGWNYSFKVGWDVDLKGFLKKVEGEEYVLKVPFMEGPRVPEGIEYEKVVVRVVLPEGAKNIKWSTPIPLASSSIEKRNSFMDTIGRPTLVLTAANAVEDWRERGEIVITYDYPWLAGYRKPVTIATAIFGIFFTAWVVGNLDVRIGKK